MSSERQRKHPADPPQLTSQKPLPFSTPSQNRLPHTPCPSLLLLVPLSIHPPDFLLLFMFFLINLCLLPADWLLVLPLDLWLTVFNPVYNTRAESSWTKELGLSHTTARSRVFSSSHCEQYRGSQREQIPCNRCQLGFLSTHCLTSSHLSGRGLPTLRA